MSQLTFTYSQNSIDRLGEQNKDKIFELYNKYPYEEFGKPIIERILRYLRIHEGRYCHQECCAAGDLAYIYSIHRFSVIDIIYAKAYISKVMKKYIICAIIISDDTKNLCDANDFRCVRIDGEHFND